MQSKKCGEDQVEMTEEEKKKSTETYSPDNGASTNFSDLRIIGEEERERIMNFNNISLV